MLLNNTIIPNLLGFEVITRKSKKLLNLFLNKNGFVNVRAHYPRTEVSVYEACSTKCVRQCCHIEGFVFFFAYPTMTENFYEKNDKFQTNIL